MSAIKSIVVKKATIWSLGVRIWYVIMDDEGVIYQRWSNDGDYTDQVLMLASAGDHLNIEIGEDPIHSISKVAVSHTQLSAFGDNGIDEAANTIISAEFIK